MDKYLRDPSSGPELSSWGLETNLTSQREWRKWGPCHRAGKTGMVSWNLGYSGGGWLLTYRGRVEPDSSPRKLWWVFSRQQPVFNRQKLLHCWCSLSFYIEAPAPHWYQLLAAGTGKGLWEPRKSQVPEEKVYWAVIWLEPEALGGWRERFSHPTCKYLAIQNELGVVQLLLRGKHQCRRETDQLFVDITPA